VLAAAFVGVLVLVGLSRLVSSDSSTAISPSAATLPVTVAPSAAVPAASTTVAPTTVASTIVPTTAAPTTAVPTTAVPTTAAAPGEGCPAVGPAAVVDRNAQRAWLCDSGQIVSTFPMTSAWTMPDPGTYAVYAKDMNASSNFGGHFSTMTHFVAFTYGKNTGARVAFHSMPVLTSGEFVQPLDSVGDRSRRGESSGCIRVLPDDAVRIWDSLAIGDAVVVLN
jgi:lipoprotein-anchoring transpeptidase ErfK/SrfK